MCLCKVTKRIEKPTKQRKRAWGWFVAVEYGGLVGETKFSVYTAGVSAGVETDWWNRRNSEAEMTVRPSADPSEYYQRGFHKFAHKAEALQSGYNMPGRVLLPVTLRKVRTIGTGDGLVVSAPQGRDFVCYVADEMYVSSKEVLKAIRAKERKERVCASTK